MEDPKEVQSAVFRRQIAIAKEMHLPISIHTREAIEDTYQILKEEKSLISAASCIVSVVMANGQSAFWI